MSQRQRRPQTLSKRNRLDQRQTMNYTAPNLRGSVRPVDTSVTPDVSSVGSKAKTLADKLGLVSQQIQTMQPFMKQYAESQYEKGKMQALKGEEASGGYYAIEAYETTKGEITARKEYRQALNEYYQENHGVLDPEEFQEGLEQLAVDFMDGQTDNFVAGFAPTAQGLEMKALENYQAYVVEEQHLENLDTVGNFMREETSLFLDLMVEDKYGESMGIDSLDSLLEDDITNYTTFFKDSENQQQITGAMRQILTQAQEKGKKMGLSRREVTEQFVAYMTRTAVLKGIPELLDVMNVKDKDGMTIVGGLLGGEVDEARYQAETKIERELEAVRREAEATRLAKQKAKEEELKRQKEKEDQMRTNKTREDLFKISQIENLVDREEALNQYKEEYLTNEWYYSLEDGRFNSINNFINEIRESTNDPEDLVSDTDLLVEFDRQLVLEDELDVDAVVEARRNKQLTEDDYMDIMGRYFRKVNNLMDEQQAEMENFQDKEQANKMITNISKLLTADDEGLIFADQVKAETLAIQQEALDGIERFYQKNGRYPMMINDEGQEEFKEKILKPIINSRGTTYEQLVSGQSYGDSQARTEVEQTVPQANNLTTRHIKDINTKLKEYDEAWFKGNEEVALNETLKQYGFPEGVENARALDKTSEEFTVQVGSLLDQGADLGSVFKYIDEQASNPDKALTEEVAEIYKMGYLVENVVNPVLISDKFNNIGEVMTEVSNTLTNEYGLGPDYVSKASSYIINVLYSQ